MEPSFSLKDELFNKETVLEVGCAIQKVYSEFEVEDFTNTCVKGFKERELKERMTYMSECLDQYLPNDYIEATNLLLYVCEHAGDSDFVYGSFCNFVERHGCINEYVDHSLYMLGEYTKVFSSEFAIRSFINNYPNKTLEAMMKWSMSDNVHQRRLASEGLRPKLPWAKSIDLDIKEAMKPLENLFYDNERYVTRSVANHLNDLSKMDPDLVIETLARWKKSGKQNKSEMAYIISHSTRTLVKKGHLKTLDFLGYKPDVKIKIEGFDVLNKDINIGEGIEIVFDIVSLEDVNLIVDYIVEYPMANDKRSKKVFKIKKMSLKQGERMTIKKKHVFKKMTTKKLYSGKHNITLQINGKLYSSDSFNLKV